MYDIEEDGQDEKISSKVPDTNFDIEIEEVIDAAEKKQEKEFRDAK